MTGLERKGNNTKRTKVSIPRGTGICLFTVCECKVFISPLRNCNYTSRYLSKVSQWCRHVCAPFPCFAIPFCISDEVQLSPVSTRMFLSSAIPCRITLLSFQISKSFPALQALAVASLLSFLPWIQSVHESSPRGSC